MEARRLFPHFIFILGILMFAVLVSGCDSIIVSETPEPTATVSATLEPTGDSEADQSNSSADTAVIAEGQLLSTPTLAPTATPGIISQVVSGVTEIAGLEQTYFLGLSTEDWINLAISLGIVILGFTLIGRIVYFLLCQIVKRTSYKQDDKFLKRIRTDVLRFIGIMSLQFATIRLVFIEAEVKAWPG